MTTDRDRLAADLDAVMSGMTEADRRCGWRVPAAWLADRLIALGWTRRASGDPIGLCNLTCGHQGSHDTNPMAGDDLAYAAGREDGLREALDEERLARAARRHYLAERDAWANRGESGVIHVCGWHDPKCAAAIAKAYREVHR